MKHGIHIPANVVRLTVGALAAATMMALAFSASDVMRYMKMTKM
jgi:hypothetical protein